MHLREAYRTYSGLEQDFPEWVNTSAACVRWLGDVANERGDRAEAERLYREAVALQEALLRSKDVPDLITIEFLCWSRFDLARFLNSAPAERAGAAEPLFQGVLQAAESGLKLDPQHRGCQFARALANWHLGIHYQSSGRTEEAIPLLRHSLEDAQSLIADNPWAEYWGTLRDSLNALLQAQQSLGDSEGAKQTVLQTYHWLRKTAPRVPDDPGPQKKLLECQAQIVTLMRSSGQERDADALSRDATARLQDVINHAELAGDADQLTIVYATAIPLLMGSEQPEQARELCRRLLYVTPQNAQALNRVAWFLATAENPAHRDATLAIKFGKRAVELIPQDGNIWNTLGAAQFRAGDFPGAIEALEKSMELRSGGDASDWFFLAMAEWQLGHKDQARTWYDKAVEWMDKNQPKNEELLRFRAEAAELLGIQSPATNNHEPNT
jgi:tetratricopeptide (TPR) repeat protein